MITAHEKIRVRRLLGEIEDFRFVGLSIGAGFGVTRGTLVATYESERQLTYNVTRSMAGLAQHSGSEPLMLYVEIDGSEIISVLPRFARRPGETPVIDARLQCDIVHRIAAAKGWRRRDDAREELRAIAWLNRPPFPIHNEWL